MKKNNLICLMLVFGVMILLSGFVSAGFDPGPICGNGMTEDGEECDDGRNGDDTDQCYDDCSYTYLGDGIIQCLNGEGVCEECDGTDFGDESCQSRGYDLGSLNCDYDGSIDDSECWNEGCGNGNCDSGETCSSCPSDCFCTDCNLWEDEGYCSRMECEVMNDGDDTTWWVRGLYPISRPKKMFDAWEPRLSKLGCEYFYQPDKERSISDLLETHKKNHRITSGPGLDEYLNLDGLISVIRRFEAMTGNPSGPDMLKIIFFNGYYSYLKEGGVKDGGSELANEWKRYITGYTLLYRHYKLNLPRYRYYSMLSREIPELDNADLESSFSISVSDVNSEISTNYLNKYCRQEGDSYSCDLSESLDCTNYGGQLAVGCSKGSFTGESLIKRVMLPGFKLEFSLTHLSQIYLAGWGGSFPSRVIWAGVGYIEDELQKIAVGGQNAQNRLGDFLGMYALQYFKIFPYNKLSDFLQHLAGLDSLFEFNIELCEAPPFDPTDIQMSTTLRNRVTNVCGAYKQ